MIHRRPGSMLWLILVKYFLLVFLLSALPASPTPSNGRDTLRTRTRGIALTLSQCRTSLLPDYP